MDSLPAEIIAHVLDYARDITCVLVCARWRDIAISLKWYQHVRAASILASMTPAQQLRVHTRLTKMLPMLLPPPDALDHSLWSDSTRVYSRRTDGTPEYDVYNSKWTSFEYTVRLNAGGIQVQTRRGINALCECLTLGIHDITYSCMYCKYTLVNETVREVVRALRNYLRHSPKK